MTSLLCSVYKPQFKVKNGGKKFKINVILYHKNINGVRIKKTHTHSKTISAAKLFCNIWENTTLKKTLLNQSQDPAAVSNLEHVHKNNN